MDERDRWSEIQRTCLLRWCRVVIRRGWISNQWQSLHVHRVWPHIRWWLSPRCRHIYSNMTWLNIFLIDRFQFWLNNPSHHASILSMFANVCHLVIDKPFKVSRSTHYRSGRCPLPDHSILTRRTDQISRVIDSEIVEGLFLDEIVRTNELILAIFVL